MLENAIYSVISPEGCASILWRDPSKSLEAARAMKMTAEELLKIKIIDEIIQEPVGGAHRNKKEVVDVVRDSIKRHLEEFVTQNGNQILEHRKKKFLNVGKQKSYKIFSAKDDWIKNNNFFAKIKELTIRFKKEFIILILLVFVGSIFFF